MPSLNKAREGAKVVVCTSNLRQLGFAVYGYSAANGEKILASARNGAGELPALGNQDPAYAGPLWFEVLKTSKYIEYAGKSSGILHCPSDKRSKLTYSYSANRNVMGFDGSTDPSEAKRFPVWKWTSIKRNLSGIILLGERGAANPGQSGEIGARWSAAGSSVWTYGGQIGNQVGFFMGRHSNAKVQGKYTNAKLTRLKVPFALADGHAEVFMKDLPCYYDKNAFSYSGVEIDKAYVDKDSPDSAWPRLLPVDESWYASR